MLRRTKEQVCLWDTSIRGHSEVLWGASWANIYLRDLREAKQFVIKKMYSCMDRHKSEVGAC